MYIFGGKFNQKASSELWSFDTRTLRWSLLPSQGSAPLSVSGHTATLVGSKMIILFGYGPQRGYTDKVQEYNLGKIIFLVLIKDLNMRTTQLTQHTCEVLLNFTLAALELLTGLFPINYN